MTNRGYTNGKFLCPHQASMPTSKPLLESMRKSNWASMTIKTRYYYTFGYCRPSQKSLLDITILDDVRTWMKTSD